MIFFLYQDDGALGKSGPSTETTLSPGATEIHVFYKWPDAYRWRDKVIGTRRKNVRITPISRTLWHDEKGEILEHVTAIRRHRGKTAYDLLGMGDE